MKGVVHVRSVPSQRGGWSPRTTRGHAGTCLVNTESEREDDTLVLMKRTLNPTEVRERQQEAESRNSISASTITELRQTSQSEDGAQKV